jgi:hypothetical protein
MPLSGFPKGTTVYKPMIRASELRERERNNRSVNPVQLSLDVEQIRAIRIDQEKKKKEYEEIEESLEAAEDKIERGKKHMLLEIHNRAEHQKWSLNKLIDKLQDALK